MAYRLPARGAARNIFSSETKTTAPRYPVGLEIADKDSDSTNEDVVENLLTGNKRLNVPLSRVLPPPSLSSALLLPPSSSTLSPSQSLPPLPLVHAPVHPPVPVFHSVAPDPPTPSFSSSVSPLRDPLPGRSSFSSSSSSSSLSSSVSLVDAPPSRSFSFVNVPRPAIRPAPMPASAGKRKRDDEDTDDDDDKSSVAEIIERPPSSSGRPIPTLKIPERRIPPDGPTTNGFHFFLSWDGDKKVEVIPRVIT